MKEKKAKRPRIPARVEDLEAMKVASILHVRDLHREVQENSGTSRRPLGEQRIKPMLAPFLQRINGGALKVRESEMFVEIEHLKTFAEVAILYGRTTGGPVVGIFTKTDYGKTYKAKAAGFADYVAKCNGGLRIHVVGENRRSGRPDHDWKSQRRVQWR